MKFLVSIAMFFALTVECAHAAILWAGGEDIDFPNGSAPCTATNGYFRSGFARASLWACGNGAISISNPFTGGAITSGWISFRASAWQYLQNNQRFVGFGKSGTGSAIFLGSDSGNSNKMALWKYDGTTFTEIASETGTSYLNTGTVYKFDMQIISYGASATVNVYLNGGASPLFSYTGNVLAGSATTLDEVVLSGYANYGSNYYENYSEIFVSDSDTRLLSLATLAPNAAGDLNQWTGAYTNINPATINDTSVVSDTTSGDTFECKLNSLPSGNFSILGVKVGARTAKYGAGLTSIAVGVKTNATVSVPGATALGTAFTETETYYPINPVTSANWTSTEINALQINLKSAP